MQPLTLQSAPYNLRHSPEQITGSGQPRNFYTGTINKLSLIKEPCFVLFSRLVEEGPNGEELEFEYITVQYLGDNCDRQDPPVDATHFSLVSEPPVSPEQALNLQQAFSWQVTNFPLTIPVTDPF